MDFWTMVGRLMTIVGGIGTSLSTYYAMATYYGWNLPVSAPAQMSAPASPDRWWLFALGGIGASLFTGLGLWIWRSRRRRSAEREAKDAIKIEFRWRPARRADPIEIDVFVSARRSVSDLAVIGTAAKAAYYMDGTAEWIWQPSVRLFHSDYLYKGENRSAPILRCPRQDPENNGILLLNTHSIPSRDRTMLRVKVSVVSRAKSWEKHADYFVKRFGEYLDIQPAQEQAVRQIEDHDKRA